MRCTKTLGALALCISLTGSATAGPGRRSASVQTQTKRAQDGQWLSAPSLGLIQDEPSSTLRVITGVPGSALVSSPRALPEGVRRLHLAPGQDWALGESADGSPLAALRLTGEHSGELTLVEDTPSAADLVVFSPRADRALVLDRSTTSAWVLVQGSSQVRLDARLNFAGVPADLVDLAAIDDAGTAPVLFLRDGRGYRLSEAGPQLVFSGRHVTAASYLPGKDTLLVADAAQVLIIEGTGASPAAQPLLTLDTTPDSRLFVSPSRDGQSAFVAVRGSRSAWRIDLATSVARECTLPVPAERFTRLRNGDTFLVSATPDEAAWLLLGDELDLRSVFAPAPATDASIDQQNSIGLAGKEQ